jgi:predicted lipid-binding transport protein (Tim44 family)
MPPNRPEFLTQNRMGQVSAVSGNRKPLIEDYMKVFLHLFTVLLMVFAVTQQAEAAKKFGSGGFGKSYNTPSRITPGPSPKQATPAQQQAQPGAANSQPRRSGLLAGMLGGLLAGGLFAYLLGSGAFEGLQLTDILLLAGIGLAIFLFLRNRTAQPAYGMTGTSYPTHQHQNPMARNVTAHNTVTDTVMPHVDLSSMMNTGNSAPMNLPADFDKAAFSMSAMEHYRTLQQAWNDGDMEKIRGYVAPELFDNLARQRAGMSNEPPRTEVLDLTADIVRADQIGSIRQISLLFRGRCRDLLENSEDGIFDTWHLERDMGKDNAPWLVVGIEAE